MTGETLSTRRLNRALLARQHLLERSIQPITQVIEGIGGLQTQYAPSGYTGLWSRMAGFQSDDLTSALAAREVIHGTLMRVTIHSVTAADYWPMAIGVRESRREWLDRVTRSQRGDLDFAALAEAVREVLADGPLKARELSRRVVERGFTEQQVGWAGVWVDLVRVPPSGTWEHRANDLYGLAEQWLPLAAQHPIAPPTEEEGIALLLERYLAGFGPARPADFADWAGIPMRRATPAIKAADLRHFRDEQGRDLVDLPGAPLPPEDTPAPVRFLAPFDPTLLTNCRRTGILPDDMRQAIFSGVTGWTIGVFLVDGQVVGRWRYERDQIATYPLVTLTPRQRRELEAESAKFGEFYERGSAYAAPAETGVLG